MAVHLWRDAKTPLVTEDARPVPRTALSAFRLGLFTQLANPKPAVMFSAIFLGTVPQGTPIWIYGALLALIFTAETAWNSLVARIFSLERTRARYISLKTIIDRSFGGLLALLGIKIAAT
jgi:threonine/homoserine/homoserine lactone efflux protein